MALIVQVGLQRKENRGLFEENNQGMIMDSMNNPCLLFLKGIWRIEMFFFEKYASEGESVKCQKFDLLFYF